MATATADKQDQAPDTEPEVTEVASFDELMGKPKRVADVPVLFPGKTSNDKPVKKIVKMQAISAVDYDELVAEFAPNRSQRDQGYNYDPERFQPALVAACMVEPSMSRDQAVSLYKNPRWAGGEFATFFLAAQRLCNVTMDVPFSATA